MAAITLLNKRGSQRDNNNSHHLHEKINSNVMNFIDVGKESQNSNKNATYLK